MVGQCSNGWGLPADVIDKASLYLMIIFIGMPSNMAYNFGSAILRAMGDTKRPLYFLSAAGVLNVVLNLIFVIVLHMDVAGVALATILSETLSAVLILNCLCRTDGPCHLNIRKLYIQKDQLIRMLRIGAASRNPEWYVFLFQCADPVLHQLLWFSSHGRQQCFCQYRKFCIYFHEWSSSGNGQLRKPE